MGLVIPLAVVCVQVGATAEGARLYYCFAFVAGRARARTVGRFSAALLVKIWDTWLGCRRGIYKHESFEF